MWSSCFGLCTEVLQEFLLVCLNVSFGRTRFIEIDQPESKYIGSDVRFQRPPLHEVSSVVKNTLGRRITPKG